MKHYYIYKNNNLAAFDVEMARPDYFYVGQFDDERQALDHLKDMWHSLIAENRKLAYKLDIPLEINIEEVRDKYELMFEFRKALEFNSKLAFHALQQ